MRGVLTCLESSKSRPSSQPPQRLRHLELHAFGALGSTFAMCPPKTLFAPPPVCSTLAPALAAALFIWLAVD